MASLPIDSYVAGLRARAAAREQRAAERAARVLAALPALARELETRFGCARVGYFGSLRTGALDETSDVDLYVDAVRRGEYFRAIDVACEALGADVDLVELEDAPESLRREIAEHGVDVGP